MSAACAFVFSISRNLSKHLKRLLVCINLHEAVVKIQRRPILVKLSILQKSQMYKIMRSFVVFQNCFCRQVTVYVHILQTFYYILKFQKQPWEAIYKRICQKKTGENNFKNTCFHLLEKFPLEQFPEELFSKIPLGGGF